MLTAEENAALTQVGPDAPMGRLMRWYWHPIAASSQLDENPVRPVKLLGESLVLYRDRSGKLEDPFGHVWLLSTRKENLSPDEMQKRFAALMAEDAP